MEAAPPRGAGGGLLGRPWPAPPGGRGGPAGGRGRAPPRPRGAGRGTTYWPALAAPCLEALSARRVSRVLPFLALASSAESRRSITSTLPPAAWTALRAPAAVAATGYGRLAG